MLIEIIENSLQTAILLICAVISLIRAAADRSRAWTLTFFFYGSGALGDIYWLVCLLFFGVSPQITLVSDLSWAASYIFLYLLLRQTAAPEENGKLRLLPWIGPVFSAAAAVYFMQWGSVLSNLYLAVLMGLLSYSAIHRLMAGERFRKQRLLLVSILVLYLLEYALWISSCIWEYTPTSPYYWFDILLTVSFPIFIFGTKKAVAE
jgi:hypothetical protein